MFRIFFVLFIILVGQVAQAEGRRPRNLQEFLRQIRGRHPQAQGFRDLRHNIWKSQLQEGCEDNAVVVNGQVLSILFNNFTVNMPMGDAGGDGMMKRVACRFDLDITPPEGMVLTGFRQVLSGGFIKSKGSFANIGLQYKISGPMLMKNLAFNMGESIGPDSPRSVFNQIYDDVIPAARRCREVQSYTVRVAMNATRLSRAEYIVGGLDSLDAEATPSLSVTPVWRACR